MKFGIFYELQLPRPWGPDSELNLYHNALDQLELADRLGYDFAWEVEHHFLEEYSHSPAPGGVPRRGQPAHPADPPRARHHATDDGASRARRRADRGARSGEPRPCRIRHGRERQHHRARTVRPQLRRKTRGLGGRGARGHPDVQGRRLRIPRDLFRFPAAQCRAQAVAEAASAVMGRVLGARHDRDGRAPRPRRARLPVPERRCGACLGPRLLQFLHQAARQAGGLRHQPEYRSDQLFHVRRDRRGSAPPRRRHPVLPVRAALLRAEPQPQTARPRHGRFVGRVREVEARQPRGSRPRTVRRPDRLARDACAASCGGSRARISTRSSC